MKKHVILLSLFLAVACNLRSVANSFSSSLKGKDWLNITEIMADNAPWSVTTAYRTIGGGNYSSDISQINSIWRACYTNIGRTNYFLNNYKRSSRVPLDILERYASEAYFYRAYNYWMLTSFFGDVPYITEELNIDSPDVFRNLKITFNISRNTLPQARKISGVYPKLQPMHCYQEFTYTMSNGARQ